MHEHNQNEYFICLIQMNLTLYQRKFYFTKILLKEIVKELSLNKKEKKRKLKRRNIYYLESVQFLSRCQYSVVQLFAKGIPMITVVFQSQAKCQDHTLNKN